MLLHIFFLMGCLGSSLVLLIMFDSSDHYNRLYIQEYMQFRSCLGISTMQLQFIYYQKRMKIEYELKEPELKQLQPGKL